ncbi:MAG: hypothetical protein ABUM51_04195, partial [Bacteroidota bacterium]
FPQKDTTILVGTININKNVPVIAYAVPTYQYSSHLCCQMGTIYYYPDGRVKSYSEDYTPPIRIPDMGGVVSNNKALRLRLKFAITNWSATANNLTVQLGSQPPQTVSRGATEVVFENVLDVTPALSFSINGQPTYYNPRESAWRPSPLKLEWNTAGAGVVVLPVLPVTIMYAPVADSRKLNTSSAAGTTSTGNTLSVGFDTTHSNTQPVPTSFQTITTVSSDMSAVGTGLMTTGDPDAMAVGSVLKTLSGILTSASGSSTINQTLSNSVTSQQTLAVSSSSTLQLTAHSSEGGPGTGDAICFYKNVRLLWYSHQGRMQLALLGYDPTLTTPTAGQLKTALVQLRGRPHGTKDAVWGLDSASILNLLNLDPFTGPDSTHTALDPARFSAATTDQGMPASFQVGGNDVMATIVHTIMATDLQASASSQSLTEVDKAGPLAFLGIGPSEDKTLVTSFTQRASSQSTIGRTVTNSYTLHGTTADHYHCDVFYDNVFGTFAFRDPVTEFERVERITGTLTDSTGNKLASTQVILHAGQQSITTVTDPKGQFRFHLPYGLNNQEISLQSDSARLKLNYT